MRNIHPEHEAKCNELRSAFGRQAVALIRATCHPRAEEYINESEHQDGCECWDENFHGSIAEVQADFRLYLTYS